jgi:hypothetical protein
MGEAGTLVLLSMMCFLRELQKRQSSNVNHRISGHESTMIESDQSIRHHDCELMIDHVMNE